MSSASTTTVGTPGSIGAGIGLRLLATLFFSLMSLSVRIASVEAPVGQIVFWRSAVAIVPILAYLALRGQLRHGLKTNCPIGQALAAIAFYFALVCALCGLASLSLGWAEIDQSALLAPIASGLFGGFVHIAMIWALLFDLAIFALWPSPISLVGALVVVVAVIGVAFADRIGERLRRLIR